MTYADKEIEIQEFKNLVHQEYLVKPWILSDIFPFHRTFVDVTESEPNNACPGNPYTLGNTFHGAIDPSGDWDWISFTCDAGTEITIGTDADGSLPTVDTYIELYENDCSTMLTSNDDGGPGLYSLIESFPAPYTGTYHLKVRAYSTSATGNYILLGYCTIPPESEYETEPNDDCPGNSYTMGYIFHGGIIPGGDVDWVQFDCVAGDLLTIGTAQDGALSTVDTKIELYESDCTTLLDSDDDGGPGLYSLISGFPVPYTGTYHLKIFGYSSYSNGNYILEGELTPADPDDICPGVEYVLGTDYSGEINPGGDIDWVFFTCEGGDILTIGTNPDGYLPTVDTKIELYESDCTTIIASDDDGGPGLYSLITAAVPYTGTYSLKIFGYSSTSVGNYLLQGTCTSPPENDVCETAIPITRCIYFTDEGTTGFANNDYTPSDYVTGGCTGYYAQGGDLVYRLDLQGNEELHIEYWNSADASVYIITDCSDPQNTCVAGSDNTYTGNVETLDFIPTAPGVYWLIIDTFSSYTPGGAFWLTVDWTACPTPNCPRSVGFWGRQALQRGNGSTKFDMDEMIQIAECVDEVSTFFDWGDDDFNQFLVTVLPSRQMTIRKQAERQFAGLLANYCTGAIGLIASNGDEIGVSLTAPVSCPGMSGGTVGEVLTEADAALAALEPQNLDDPDVIAQYEDVKDCLDMINNGLGIGPMCEEVEEGWVLIFSDEELLELQTDVKTVIIPDQARLLMARPNPFSGSTRLIYSVPASGADVRIEVFSVSGRRVRQLESGQRGTGIYEVNWNGCNDAGVKVSAGVYFCRAKIGDYSAVNRVILLR